MNVFDELVGQEDAVGTLRRATRAADTVIRSSGATATAGGEPGSAAGSDMGGDQDIYPGGDPGGDMTHSWLFTGPPGSGRSVAARAFAAALQCAEGTGCGRCAGCHTTLAGTHADVRRVVPDGLSVPVSQMRELVLRAASAPTGGRWQVMLIEDADRLTEAAGNALLKAVEEPPVRTVFLLCAPSLHPDDIPVTIRSRCRVVALRQPRPEAVATLLRERDAVPAQTASWAAAASLGHVGRAKRLAADPQARERRDAVLGVPRRLTGVGACFDAAGALIEAAEAEAAASVGPAEAAEREALETALGAGATGRGTAGVVRGAAGQLKELERRQKSRATRSQRDALDRALVDLVGFYRDVLTVQLGAPVAPVHSDRAETASAAASTWTPASTLRRIEAVLACRTAIGENVKPRIAAESMMLALWRG